MTRRIAIVLNPAAGRGRAGRLLPALKRLIREVADRASPTQRADWEILQTSSGGQATEIAAQCAQSGFDVVAAAGGDGTLSEVLNGIVGASSVLALLPMGTGNDFARTVGLDGSLRSAVETLFSGVRKPIDIGLVHGRYFLNVAGCGFDAAVAETANRGPRWLSGAPAYIAAVVRTLPRFRAADACLTIDGRRCSGRIMLCSVANARTYGGGMRIAPDARIDDGLFDLCILAEASIHEFLLAFPRVFSGRHATHPRITMARAARINIETQPPVPLLIDGDVRGTTPAEFTIIPAGIDFLFPGSG